VGQAQHLLGRVSAFGSARIFLAVSALQIGAEDLEEQLQGAAVAVVEGRAGHTGALGQIGDRDLRDAALGGELHDRMPEGLLRAGDAWIGALSHRATAASRGAGAARSTTVGCSATCRSPPPAPLVFGLALFLLLGIPWALAVAHRLGDATDRPTE